MKITLCLLTWNELVGCKFDLPNIPRQEFDEIYVLDGGSTDGTIAYCQEQGLTVHGQKKPGYNNAYREALQHCTTEAIIFFHPKGTIDPQETLKFRPLFEQGHDLVVASRIIKGAVNEEDVNLLKPRKWFVLGLGILSSLLWRRQGNIILDVLHGFRGIRMSAVPAIILLDRGLSGDIEMVVRSYKKRLRRVEFPVAEKPRLHGQTHFKAFATGKKLLQYLWFEFLRKD